MKFLRIYLLTIISSMIFIQCSSATMGGEDEITPPPPPPNSKTTYEKDVKTVINNSCATSSCHDATAPSANLPLTNFTQVKNAALNGNLIGRINSSTSPMPPTGKNNSIVTLIDNWKNDGYLEN